MRTKRITAFLLSMVTAVSLLAGCGGVDKNKTVATLNDEPISLGIANFTARLLQANADDFYRQLFGEDVWSRDMYGSGKTMAESFKEDAIKTVQDMYTLQLHMDDYNVSLSDDEKAAITEAAQAFISDNDKDALNALGATEDIVEEYLTLTTIQTKMREAIIADADTEVSDDDAKTSSYSYVTISKTDSTSSSTESVDGTEVAESTEEQEAQAKAEAEEFAAKAAEDGLEAAADSYGYTVSTGTFRADGENSSIKEEVLNQLQMLKEGGISGAIDTDNSYYVVRLDKEFDEDATEETRQSIIKDRQDTLYDDVLAGFEEKDTWKLKSKVWDTVTFDNLFTLVKDSTETVENTEATTELQ